MHLTVCGKNTYKPDTACVVGVYMVHSFHIVLDISVDCKIELNKIYDIYGNGKGDHLAEFPLRETTFLIGFKKKKLD